MVWLFGGGFEAGSTSPPLTDAQGLMRAGDVVVVALNYRVGAFGFLHLSDLGGAEWESCSNVGHLDQAAGLRWVQQNIAAFGGDPRQVTVFGQSAGAFSIAALMHMPEAKGTFHRAIMQSGHGSRVVDAGQGTRLAHTLLAGLGVSNPGELIEVPAERIIAAQQRVVDRDIRARNHASGRAWGTVVDGQVVRQKPLDALADGAAMEIDLLIGANKDETQLWEVIDRARYAPASEDALDAEIWEIVGASLAGQLDAIYRQREPDASLARRRTRFLSDLIYRVPAAEFAIAHEFAGGRAWMYLFAKQARLVGACHGGELPYVFGAVSGSEDDDSRLSREMVDVWTRFAREGDPGWCRYGQGQTRMTRLFGGDLDIVPEPPDDLARLWLTSGAR